MVYGDKRVQERTGMQLVRKQSHMGGHIAISSIHYILLPLLNFPACSTYIPDHYQAPLLQMQILYSPLHKTHIFLCNTLFLDYDEDQGRILL
jgi:hypothetical protein